MKRSYIFLATGFEEIEALATADVLRRCGMEVSLVSILKDRLVTGANGITVAADFVLEGSDYADADWLICPGGMPGASNLFECENLTALLKRHASEGGHLAAICAAPAVVLSQLGLLKGRNATCYPGFEDMMVQGGAHPQPARVVVDGNIVTGNGPSSAIPFALKIAELTVGKAAADQVAEGMLVNFKG